MPNSNNSNNTMSSHDADELWNIAASRQSKTGTGLSAASINVFKTTALTTGGVMMRAATGRLGNNIAARRVLNATLLLDGSGSMANARAGVIAGLNEMTADLKNSRESDSIELTIWIFSRDDYGRSPDARLMTVDDPNNPGQKMEVVNIPIMDMPDIQMDDYETDGTTPMNKTLLAAMGAGSLRAEALRMGINGKNRRSSMNYLICASDGLNNIYSDTIATGKVVSYDDSEVSKIARELLQTEQWLLGFAYAGGNQSAEYYAKNLGFNQWRDVANNGESWRKFFGIVSKSIQQASMAPNASQQNVNAINNTFMSGI